MVKITNVKTVFQADINCSCKSYWNNTSAKKTKVTRVISLYALLPYMR